jgi:hypothetical protein
VPDPESPLELAEQIYAPFMHTEVRRLQHFVADVEGLAKSPLFSEQQNVFHISADMNGPVEQKLDYNGEEAIHAVVGRFRQLYNTRERSSYSQVLKLLGEHVHQRESPLQREALDALKELRTWEKDVRNAKSGIEINFNDEVLTGSVLIDMFVHGHYLHKGNELSDKLDAFPLRGILLSEFIRAMTMLIQVFWVGRNVVVEILKTPSLLPAPAAV